jgi:hypothetical protein
MAIKSFRMKDEDLKTLQDLYDILIHFKHLDIKNDSDVMRYAIAFTFSKTKDFFDTSKRNTDLVSQRITDKKTVYINRIQGNKISLDGSKKE